MVSLKLSFAPYSGSPPEDQLHNLGNIADDVWKERLGLVRDDVVD